MFVFVLARVFQVARSGAVTMDGSHPHTEPPNEPLLSLLPPKSFNFPDTTPTSLFAAGPIARASVGRTHAFGAAQKTPHPARASR